MKYARIEDGVVAELLETDRDITEMFHPALVWVDVTDISPPPKIGWMRSGDVLGPPSQPKRKPEEIEAEKAAIVQAHMDAAARALRYDDMKTAVTYAEEPAVPKFQAEGRALRAWRSLVWEECYAILAEVTSGECDIPTDEELIAALPRLVLPAS